MVIMIISFRGKTTTDWPDQTDTNKKEGATPDPSIREGNKKEDEQSSSRTLTKCIVFSAHPSAFATHFPTPRMFLLAALNAR